MTASSYTVVLALFAGSLRALTLWRASIGVEVVNVAVLGALAEGRGRELGAMLGRLGSAPFLDVARAIGQALLELRAAGSGGAELNQRLRHAADVAVLVAIRRLRRSAWLDYVSLAAIAYTGLETAARGRALAFDVAGMIAATLLWVSNLRGARGIATRIYAGATALVDSLLAGLDRVPAFADERPGT